VLFRSVIPWINGKQHKEMMTKVPHISTFIWFLRDKGAGQISLDKAGNSVASYALTDETDQKNFRHATAEAIRIHEAAGAQEIMVSLAHNQLIWKRGTNLENFIQSVMKQPLLNGAQPMISAHQLCTCRMGTDPATSVANTDGELRDVKGVWIGDGSACPTALGANPMITIMALAARTADKMGGSPSHRDTDNVALNMIQGMANMMNPANMFREMLGIMTNPLSVFTLGQRMLSGRMESEAGNGDRRGKARGTPP